MTDTRVTIAGLMARLAPAAEGPVSFRVELVAGTGDEACALIHVFDAYDCKGTEAEISGLLRDCAIAWRIVWH